LEVEVWRREVSDWRRLKQLEAENTRMKKLLADAMLDKAVSKLARRLFLRCYASAY